jgi:hypothetical protein
VLVDTDQDPGVKVAFYFEKSTRKQYPQQQYFILLKVLTFFSGVEHHLVPALQNSFKGTVA